MFRIDSLNGADQQRVISAIENTPLHFFGEKLRVASADNPYWQLAAWLNQEVRQYRKQQPRQTMILGVSGAQGSGKTSLCQLLGLMLTLGYQTPTCSLSIDDVYHTYQDRATLAAKIHPLLQTRGVPGTHDTQLATAVLHQIKHFGKTQSVLLPQFDKAMDDRCAPQDWVATQPPIDLLLFEGWCVGARAQTEQALKNPENELELVEDTQMIWRRFVNDQLKGPYKTLFAQMDRNLFLQIPDISCILPWRYQQEQQLAKHYNTDQTKLMTRTELVRFIQHYQRLTRHLLVTMPTYADISVKLDAQHTIVELNGPKPV